MIKSPNLIFFFHKSLKSIDGQTKYVQGLLSAISSIFNVIVPSEEFFDSNKAKFKHWSSRVIGVNMFLLHWIIKNHGTLKSDIGLFVMEDRYVLIPSILLALGFRVKMISRLSDWGQEYVSSIKLRSKTLGLLFSLYEIIYASVVLNLSSKFIVPSEFLRSQIQQYSAKEVAIFPYCPVGVKFAETEKTDRVNCYNIGRHEIYCLMVGNYEYAPNIDAANYILEDLASRLVELDNSIKIVIVGHKSKEQFGSLQIPNVEVEGEIQNMEPIYTKCHIGINPSLSPGGTSIKNIEYLMNGLYVISTPESALGVIETPLLIIAKRRDFLKVILQLSNKIRLDNFKTAKEEVTKIREYYSLSIHEEEIQQFLLKP